ncbi:hypothetical protein NGRA_2978, partial [Nosema granulosis]
YQTLSDNFDFLETIFKNDKLKKELIESFVKWKQQLFFNVLPDSEIELLESEKLKSQLLFYVTRKVCFTDYIYFYLFNDERFGSKLSENLAVEENLELKLNNLIITY